MNVDTLLHQYFSAADNVCIELFDEKNIQQDQPEVETSLLQGMSYCFYEVMDNVMIHSGKTVGIVITNYSKPDHLIQILVADECIAKLLLEMPLADLKAKTTFRGLTPMTERSILSALKRRQMQIKSK